MELAQEGRTGRRLGQINAVRNFTAILGSFFIFMGFKYFRFDYRVTFLIAAGFYLFSSLLLYAMQPGMAHAPAVHLKLHQEYRLYYLLSILFGTRKQIFLTFAPWVLVTVFHQPTTAVATLLTIGGVAGIVFQPTLGWAIDRLGEKPVLMMEAGLLIFVCAGYGLSRDIFSERAAFIIACVCFVLDQLLLSVSMARSTYLKKIAVKPEHVTPTLMMSVSMDHVFSIGIALAGGLLWSLLGYQFVFLFGGVIAVINLIAASFIRIHGHQAKPPVIAVPG
jgi:predicted MFS family arabinose efflux permease